MYDFYTSKVPTKKRGKVDRLRRWLYCWIDTIPSLRKAQIMCTSEFPNYSMKIKLQSIQLYIQYSLSVAIRPSGSFIQVFANISQLETLILCQPISGLFFKWFISLKHLQMISDLALFVPKGVSTILTTLLKREKDDVGIIWVLG